MEFLPQLRRENGFGGNHMKLITLLLIFPLLLGAVRSPSNKITHKRDFLEREHRWEEISWARTMEAIEEAPAIDPQDLEYLAIVIFCEAGADAQTNETRYMVGDVVLNRVADDRFPDTIYGVLTEELAFGRFHWTGVVWPERAEYPENQAAVQRAIEIAEELLSNTHHSELYGKGYIYQDFRVQGKDNIWSDGICFGR